MELENIVANTVYLKAREGESHLQCVWPITQQCLHPYISFFLKIVKTICKMQMKR